MLQKLKGLTQVSPFLLVSHHIKEVSYKPNLIPVVFFFLLHRILLLLNNVMKSIVQNKVLL